MGSDTMNEELENLKVSEEETKMKFIFSSDDAYLKNRLFRRVQEEVALSKDMYLYVFFDMGSIILDIDDPKNYIIFNETFSEIYNVEKKEYTFIRNDEIKGFILGFKSPDLEQLEKDLREYFEGEEE